jgi:integrase
VERFIALRPNPATRELYRRRARVGILPTLGHIRVTELTRQHVQLWVNEQTNEQTRSSATVVAWHMVLAGAIRLAVEEGEIRTNPAARVRIQRTRRKKPSVFLTRDEFAVVLKVIPPHYKPLVEFLAETGCRFGEAAALTPSDVNLDKGTVRFGATYSKGEGGRYMLGTTKTKESERVIRVPRRVLEKLDLSGERVFMTTIRTPVRGDAFRANIWLPAMKRTGLPEHRQPRIHDLRHTHATWLIDAGDVPLTAIQKRLGRKDLVTTLNIYGHPATDGEDAILAALEAPQP